MIVLMLNLGVATLLIEPVVHARFPMLMPLSAVVISRSMYD